MIKLFWCPKTRAQRAVWMLEEAGIDYQLVRIDIHDKDAPVDPFFRLASPMGKVPALADGDATLAESAAICLYLADRYPDCGLAPAADEPLRARYLYWMFFVPAVLEPAVVEKMGGWKGNRFSYGWGDFDGMIKTLEAGLAAGPWLLGEQFSAADVMVGSTVGFLRRLGALPENPVLDGYVERCRARPACQRAEAREENEGS